MKRYLLNILLIIALLIVTACGNNIDDDVNFKEDTEHDTMISITYKFTGKSEHFAFETGKVYYNENFRELLISNFKLIKDIKKVDSYSLSLYFNDRILYTDEKVEIGDEGIEKHLQNIVIGESGLAGKKDEDGNIMGESDSFLETTEETFKGGIKLEIKYCYKDDCKIEELKLSYIDFDENESSSKFIEDDLRVTIIEPELSDCADKTSVREYYRVADGRKIYAYCLLKL